MARPDYRPGRRRGPLRSALLDWAGGVLINCVFIGLAYALVQVLVTDEGTRASLTELLIAGLSPLGAGLGVWLAAGPPLYGRSLLWAIGFALLAAALLAAPLYLELSLALRPVSMVALLILVPAAARVGLMLGRAQS